MAASDLVKKQQSHVATGTTLPLENRLNMLAKLHAAVTDNQRHISEALRQDLGKGEIDAYTTEIGYTLSHIEYARKHTRSWMKPTATKMLFVNRPGTSSYYARPYGCAFIIGTWNYPFALTLTPLIAALAAGNCAIIKPSEYAPATEQCIKEIMGTSFQETEVAVVTGGPEVAQDIMGGGVDMVFFTGGTQTGKNIMRAAADTLTPVVLELGGKIPCIVDQTVHIPSAARRIVFGKFLNAGQTCMAPDYVCVHESVAGELQKSIIATIKKFYGIDPRQSSAYSRIINKRHVERLARLLEGHSIQHGGTIAPEEKYMEPTIVSIDGWDTPLMQEEIFGPVLPILTYDNATQLLTRLNSNPSPLAWYCFTEDKKFKQIIKHYAKCGTICFNGTIHALISHDLPFGGVGDSGMGRYHGKSGFDAFSYTCGVIDKHPRREIPALYPPYKTPLTLVSKLRRFIM